VKFTSSIFLLFGMLVTIAAAVGTAWGVARTSKKTKTTEMYEAENEILGKINTRLENEVKRLQIKVDTQEAALVALRESVTQRAEVQRLAESIHREETSRREEHQILMTLLKDILAQMKNNRGAIG
jgi:predicted transcriptional regulator